MAYHSDRDFRRARRAAGDSHSARESANGCRSPCRDVYRSSTLWFQFDQIDERHRRSCPVRASRLRMRPTLSRLSRGARHRWFWAYGDRRLFQEKEIAVLRSRSGCGIKPDLSRSLSGQACHEADEVTAVMQLLIIDWPIACRVRGSFDAEDGAALLHAQRRGDFGLGGYSFQLVLGLDQWNIVFALEERKDRLDFQVVGDNFLADLQGKEGLIKGEGHAIRQTHATDSDNAFPFRQRQGTRHDSVGSHDLFTDHAGRRLTAKCMHVFHESAQLGKLLRHLGRSDERAFAAANLDETATDKILNGSANGNATDLESRNEDVFGGKLVANLQDSVSDLAGQNRFDA